MPRVLLDQSIWKGHPMAFSESGSWSASSASRQRPAGVLTDRYHVKPNVYVVAVGNLEGKAVMRWASESFDDLPDTRMPPSTRKAPRPHSSINVYPREGDQAYVELGFPSYSMRSIPNSMRPWLGGDNTRRGVRARASTSASGRRKGWSTRSICSRTRTATAVSSRPTSRPRSGKRKR